MFGSNASAWPRFSAGVNAVDLADMWSNVWSVAAERPVLALLGGALKPSANKFLGGSLANFKWISLRTAWSSRSDGGKEALIPLEILLRNSGVPSNRWRASFDAWKMQHLAGGGDAYEVFNAPPFNGMQMVLLTREVFGAAGLKREIFEDHGADEESDGKKESGNDV